MPGSYWDGCPTADKQKIFKCLTVEFIAMHDYGGGIKGGGMQVKEMGESGTGSLELGDASGEVFVIPYPTPFLQFFYDANPDMLPESMRPVATPAQSTERAGEPGVEVKPEKEKPPVFDYLTPVSSTLNVSGPKRGTYTNVYTCCIDVGGRACGGKVTLYSSGDNKAETTSNAFIHIRKAALKCDFHKAVIDRLDSTSSNRVWKNGEYLPMMSFAEAFPHHVAYVWCRADGILGAHTGKKPSFRKYIRGAYDSGPPTLSHPS